MEGRELNVSTPQGNTQVFSLGKWEIFYIVSLLWYFVCTLVVSFLALVNLQQVVPHSSTSGPTCRLAFYSYVMCHIWPIFSYRFPLVWHLMYQEIRSQIAPLAGCTTASELSSSTTDNYSFYCQVALCTSTLLLMDFNQSHNFVTGCFIFWIVYSCSFLWFSLDDLCT
jgi:hypothetical protein